MQWIDKRRTGRRCKKYSQASNSASHFFFFYIRGTILLLSVSAPQCTLGRREGCEILFIEFPLVFFYDLIASYTCSISLGQSARLGWENSRWTFDLQRSKLANPLQIFARKITREKIFIDILCLFPRRCFMINFGSLFGVWKL